LLPQVTLRAFSAGTDKSGVRLVYLYARPGMLNKECAKNQGEGNDNRHEDAAK
jgi:hypothetical protein